MAETDSWPLVVCDAGPLIHLDEVGCLDLARLAAKTLGFWTHGSLGVLLRAIRVGRRTRANVLSILRELPSRSTLHIKSSLLQDIIEQVESLPEG